MHAILAFRRLVAEKARAVFWPDAVQPTREPLEPLEPLVLCEKFAHWLFNGITNHPSCRLDDNLDAVEIALVLSRILETYHLGTAQTAEERELGRVLNNVASTYLRAPR